APARRAGRGGYLDRTLAEGAPQGAAPALRLRPSAVLRNLGGEALPRQPRQGPRAVRRAPSRPRRPRRLRPTSHDLAPAACRTAARLVRPRVAGRRCTTPFARRGTNQKQF